MPASLMQGISAAHLPRAFILPRTQANVAESDRTGLI